MSPTPTFLCHPRQNQLLAALPDADWNRWRPHLERIDLEQGQVLCESGSSPTHAIFPTTAIVSLLYLTQEGGSAEVAMVGKDGMVGVSLFMGGEPLPNRAVVQRAGQAYRLNAQAVRCEVNPGGSVLTLLLRYTQDMIAQSAQIALCNRFHSIDQQLCRRLLLGLDQAPTNELTMTHEFLSRLLGVRREGVTVAAGKLQQAGVIRYSHGHIDVLDRQQLEERSCECYAMSRKESNRSVPIGMPLDPRALAGRIPMGTTVEPVLASKAIFRAPSAVKLVSHPLL